METAKIVLEVIKWAGAAILAFVNGDDAPEAKRLVEILPPELKADAEHARQRALLAAELDDDLEPDSRDDDD